MVAVHHRLSVVALYSASARLERLTLWISRVRPLAVRKLFAPHLCFLLFSLTNFLGLPLLELLFFSIELLFSPLQPFKTVFVLPETLRALATAVFRTVLVVL